MENEIFNKITNLESLMNRKVIILKTRLKNLQSLDEDTVQLAFSVLKKFFPKRDEKNYGNIETIFLVSGYWPYNSHCTNSLIEFQKRFDYDTIADGTVGGGMTLFFKSGRKRFRKKNSIISTINIEEIIQDFNSTILQNMKSFVPELTDQQNVPVREILKNYSADKVLDVDLIDQININKIYKNYIESMGKKISILTGNSGSYKDIVDEFGNCPYVGEGIDEYLTQEQENGVNEIVDFIDEIETDEVMKSRDFRKQWIKIYSGNSMFSIYLDNLGAVREIKSI
ncbi:hypothetical protein CSP5_1156 [Cuniculiplasma divulgatum]|uniref:Uncharacterized protein n=2 Tax=Cuniculiplasma divulgatum TaxID=1673428 RepID=A0A1N5V023_9ARCH|nr:hypothetical protein CSP5_1156 [Cuniculiplasma divulgatum]